MTINKRPILGRHMVDRHSKTGRLPLWDLIFCDLDAPSNKIYISKTIVNKQTGVNTQESLPSSGIFVQLGDISTHYFYQFRHMKITKYRLAVIYIGLYLPTLWL